MDRNQAIATNDAIKFAKCFSHGGFATDVVAGSKNVRRVEANTKPLRFARIRDDVGEMLETMAKT